MAQPSIASLQRELAHAYLELGNLLRRRKEGDRADNLERAIHYFEEAQKVLDPNVDAEEWLRCSVGICMSCVTPHAAEEIDNVQKAIQHASEAIRVCDRARFPELWHTLHLYLAIAYAQKGAIGYRQLADDHHKLAFDFDRAKFPALFSTLARIHSIHVEVTDILSRLDCYSESGMNKETHPEGEE
jgi:tetratricopeptide (TPR) repeat protein